MGKYKKYSYLIVLPILVVISFLFFQFVYPYHLFFKEQVQLFIFSTDYFLSYFNKPAWLACYAGDFLTQFFYLRGGGPAVLAFVFSMEWLIGVIVIKRICDTSHAWLWALLPVAADWILQCGILHGLSFSIGYIVVLALFLIYSVAKTRWMALLSGIAITFTGYWLTGSVFLVLPVLMICFDWKHRRINVLNWVLFFASVVVVPFYFRSFYLLTLHQSFIYPALEDKSLFLQLSLIFAVSLAIFVKLFEFKGIQNLIIYFSSVFIALFAGGIWLNADFNFEKILSLDSEFYFGNTDRVLELSQKYNIKDRRASYFTNMALARKGFLPDSLLNYYQPAYYGLMLPVNSDESWMSILFSNEVFYLLGDMNMAQHSAMLGNTFSPHQRSARLLKRLAEINMINGDSAAASKYLRILNKTLFYKKWAKNRQQINHASNSIDWLNEKRNQIPDVDTIRSSNDHLSSLNFLVEQKPDNLMALDYLLCYHLLNKDINSFMKVYDQFGRLIKRPVPSVYSEALLIHLIASRATQSEALSYAINPRKLKDFADYSQLYEKTKGDMNALKDRFGKSYWFYYHFATILKK